MIEPFELKIKKPLRKYESILIFHPDCKPKELQEFFKAKRTMIQNFLGSLYHIDSWGKRRLIHPIKKLNLGLYFHTLFEAKAEVIKELERTMKINEKVLRFMHVQLDSKISLEKHLENYRNIIDLSKKREEEREARKQKKFGNSNYQKASDSLSPLLHNNESLIEEKTSKTLNSDQPPLNNPSKEKPSSESKKPSE